MEDLIEKIQESEDRMNEILLEMAAAIADANRRIMEMIELSAAINADLKEIIKKASN